MKYYINYSGRLLILTNNYSNLDDLGVDTPLGNRWPCFSPHSQVRQYNRQSILRPFSLETAQNRCNADTNSYRWQKICFWLFHKSTLQEIIDLHCVSHFLCGLYFSLVNSFIISLNVWSAFCSPVFCFPVIPHTWIIYKVSILFVLNFNPSLTYIEYKDIPLIMWKTLIDYNQAPTASTSLWKIDESESRLNNTSTKRSSNGNQRHIWVSFKQQKQINMLSLTNTVMTDYIPSHGHRTHSMDSTPQHIGRFYLLRIFPEHSYLVAYIQHYKSQNCILICQNCPWGIRSRTKFLSWFNCHGTLSLSIPDTSFVIIC